MHSISTVDPNKIDLGSLAEQLVKYANLWIAVSENNQIVASGSSYGETIEQVQHKDTVVLLKVPPLDVNLAPGCE